ncbi:MAG TPA: non-canonical purine NTP pyrophosphatase, partial [Thermodesulfobacteriota bacterium]|nr:non-canonical purine NTP pyrophosphatase [Thermodesulfobacteriota bacterium]
MRLVLATSNRGKVREIRGMLMGLGVEVLALGDFPSVELPHETGATLAENALVKARAVAAATGIAALADDSGLEVDCLGGRPGVFSARYAGEGASDRDNCIKLLGELEGVPFEKRSARFRCAVAFVEPGDGGRGVEMVFEGSLEGFIATEPRGEGG